MTAIGLKSPKIATVKPLTGRTVLLCVLGFFGVVSFANGMMIHYAVSTFSGLDENNPYTEGLTYNDQIAAERAQEERHWKVDFALSRTVKGESEIDVTQRDAQGNATTGLQAFAYFEHLADRAHDQTVALNETQPGHYRLNVKVDPGAWDLTLELKHNGQQVFRSRNRVMIADAVK